MKAILTCKRILFFLTVLLIVFQHTSLNAQTKKSFFKRAWINTIARYNYFYNANEMVKKAERDAAIAHIDFFGEVVHLFPHSNEATLKGNLPVMDEVIKKCNHIITRRQYSKWVDDSWLLIGKANFFKGDFFAALEAFEYVATTYKNRPIRYNAEIWIIKTLIMLEKFDEAVALSDLMIADKNFPKKLQKELLLVSAEGLIYQRKYPLAYERLTKAIPEVKRNEHKYRRYFVAGQLAILNKNPEKAISYFKTVTKSNPTYNFDFFARINMVRMYTEPPINNLKKGRSILSKMLKDDKNLDLLDQIYFEIGMLDIKQGDKNSALKNFKNALASSNDNKELKSQIYLIVAELYFENTQYINAQKYYDSAVQVLNPESPEFEQISTRHQILTELITNLVNIDYQDSMLRLARNVAFRTKTLENIKEEERKRIEDEEFAKNNPFSNPTGFDTPMGVPGQGRQGGTPIDSRFPFYNQQLKIKGLEDFQKVWGNRELGDYWRVLSIAQTEKEDLVQKDDTLKIGEDEIEEEIVIDQLPSDIKEEDAKYFVSVPFSKKEQDLSELAMGESYFLAASIYREKLQEPAKAKFLLEQFLQKLKPNQYRENALYLLIKIYEAEGNTTKVNLLKAQLVSEFPESDFIKILDNPDLFKEGEGQNTPEQKVAAKYTLFYDAYKEKRFEEAISIYNEVKKDFPGNGLDGQFDFGYALILIEKKKPKEYYDIMVSISGNYSGTPLGDLASERVAAYDRIVGGEENSQEPSNKTSEKKYPYKKSDSNGEFIFIIEITRSMDANMAKIAFSDFNRDFRSDRGLQITTSFLDAGTRILMVTGFTSQEDVRKYIEDILVNEKFLLRIKRESDKKDFLFISKDNFNLLMSEKKWVDYREYYIKNYL